MVIVEAGEGRGRASRGGSAGSEGKQRSAAIFTGVSHSHKSLNSRIRALGTGNYKTITDNWAEYIHERATGSTGRQRSCFPPKGPLKQEPLVDVTIWGCRCWDWCVPYCLLQKETNNGETNNVEMLCCNHKVHHFKTSRILNNSSKTFKALKTFKIF